MDLAPGRWPVANSSLPRTSTMVTPSSMSSLTSEGSTSSISFLTRRRSSAPDGLISKLLNHGRVSLTSKSVAPRERPLKLACHPPSHPSRMPPHPSRTPSRQGSAGPTRLAVAAALAGAALLWGCGGGGSSTAPSGSSASFEYAGAPVPGDVQAPGFTLTDQAGHTVSLANYRGQVTVVAFLYSDCAPACVLVAQQIRGALDELARPVPVLLVSVDPSADTP